MRRKLQETDAFYQTAISKLLELCATDIHEQPIVQLTGHLCLTVENGDIFELVINDSEEEHDARGEGDQVVDNIEESSVVLDNLQDHAQLVSSLQVLESSNSVEQPDGNLCEDDSGYHCQICSKVIQTLDEFRHHMETLHECVVGYPDATNKNSTKDVHSSDGIDVAATLMPVRYKYSCPRCGSIYRTLFGLRRHEIGRHGEVISRGSSISRTVDTTAIPMMVRTVRCKYVCPLCGNVYQTRYGVRRHELKQHGRILSRGNVVKRVLDNSCSTNDGVKSKPVRYKFGCSLCENVYQSLSGLRRHEIRRHGGVISTGSSVRRVVDLTADVDCNHTCSSCGNVYQTKGGLRRHIRKHHGPVLSKDNVVQQVLENVSTELSDEQLCDASDSSEGGRLLSDANRFVCRFCNKVLRSRWSLRQHEIVYHAPLKVQGNDLIGDEGNTSPGDLAETKELSSTTGPLSKWSLGGVRTFKTKLGFYRYQANARFGWKRMKSSANNKVVQPGNAAKCDETSDVKNVRLDGIDDCELDGGADPSSVDSESWKDMYVDVKDVARSVHRTYPGQQQSIGPITCATCPELEFATYELLLKHRRNFHHRMKCHRCGSDFVGHLEFVAHARLVHPGIPIYKINMNFVCEHCSEIFSCERFLADHIDTAHRGVVHRCDECGKVLGSAHTLAVHIRDLHRRDKHRTCDACGQRFPRLVSLVDHLRDSHPDLLPEKYRQRYENLRCEQCGISFTRQGTLRRHRQTVHADRTVVQRCNACGRTFTCSRYLKRHINTHHRGRRTAADSGPMSGGRAEYKTEVEDIVADARCLDEILGGN